MDPRRLYLLRHAKSSWDDSSLPDSERPLAPRGKRAARAMAEHMADEGIAVKLVLCSPSVRTRQTLELVRGALGSPEVSFEPALYGATASGLLGRVGQVGEDVSAVMVIGHNPGLHELAVALAASGRRLGDLRAKFPTCALATLELEGGWADLGPGGATLAELVKPRELK